MSAQFRHIINKAVFRKVHAPIRYRYELGFKTTLNTVIVFKSRPK